MRLVQDVLSKFTMVPSSKSKSTVINSKLEEEMSIQKLKKDNTFYETVSCLLDDGCVIDDKEVKTAISHMLNSIYESTDNTKLENDIPMLVCVVAKRFFMTYTIHHIVKFLLVAIYEGSHNLYIH